MDLEGFQKAVNSGDEAEVRYINEIVQMACRLPNEHMPLRLLSFSFIIPRRSAIASQESSMHVSFFDFLIIMTIFEFDFVWWGSVYKSNNCINSAGVPAERLLPALERASKVLAVLHDDEVYTLPAGQKRVIKPPPKPAPTQKVAPAKPAATSSPRPAPTAASKATPSSRPTSVKAAPPPARAPAAPRPGLSFRSFRTFYRRG